MKNLINAEIDTTSRPDDRGYCGLGISNYAWRTIFESARTVIFESDDWMDCLKFIHFCL